LKWSRRLQKNRPEASDSSRSRVFTFNWLAEDKILLRRQLFFGLRKKVKFSTLDEHISKTKNANNLSLGHFEVLQSTTKFYGKSLDSTL